MADNINIEDFKGFKGFIYFDSVIDEYAAKCVKELKVNSPKGKYHRQKPYAEGWETKKAKQKKGKKATFEYEVVVWNATNYQLTHLLENGHLIVNKRNGVGWASAKPHIDKAYQSVKEPFIRAMEQAKTEFEFN